MHAEDGVVREGADGVVAAFSLGDEASIHAENLVKLAALEPDFRGRSPGGRSCLHNRPAGRRLILHAGSFVERLHTGVRAGRTR